jgi:hypothetical protein
VIPPVSPMPHQSSVFPRLRAADYDITSPVSPNYNCIAWVAEDDTRWWQPLPFGGYYWPPTVPFVWSLSVMLEVFRELGYEQCTTGDPETGYNKIVIYCDGLGDPTHGARLLESGRWTSKLGDKEDIEHDDVACLGGGLYGEAFAFMRRPT